MDGRPGLKLRLSIPSALIFDSSVAVQYQHDEGEVYLSQMTWGPSGAYQPVTTRRLKIEGRRVEDAVDLSEK